MLCNQCAGQSRLACEAKNASPLHMVAPSGVLRVIQDIKDLHKHRSHWLHGLVV